MFCVVTNRIVNPELKNKLVMEDFEELKVSALTKVGHVVNNTRKCDEQSETQKENKRDTVDYVTSFGIPVHCMLREVERQRQSKVNSAIQSRINKLQQFSTKCDLNMERDWLEQQQMFIKSHLNEEKNILKSMTQYDQLCSSKQEKLKKYYENLQEQRRKQERELREKLQKKIRENIEKIKTRHKEFVECYQYIYKTFKMCVPHEKLKETLSTDINRITILNEQFEEIVKRCKALNVSENELKMSANILVETKLLKEKYDTIINNLNTKPPETKPISAPVQPKEQEAQEKVTKDKNAIKIAKYISVTNLKIYSELINFKEQYAASLQDLVEDVSLKPFKFDCQRAINIPVNAISAGNTAHLQDKYKRLHKLLSGETVTVAEGKFSAAKHPKGIRFCMDLLAKKFVVQCDLMISVNPKSAFCYATIISSLWNDFPDLGKLLLAYLYKACPYLVPFYVPHNSEESDEEFYKNRGYRYNNGQIEEQEKFLKRMTGI